jgi:hypothetical protein
MNDPSGRELEVIKAPAKPLKLSRKMREAIELYSSGECRTWRAAAVRVGLSQEHVSRTIARPEVRAFLRERAARVISGALPRAAARLVELVDDGSAKVSLDAAKHVLGIDGLRPPAATSGPVVSINMDAPGYLIDLGLCSHCQGRLVLGPGIPPHVCAPVERRPRDVVDAEVIDPAEPTER